MLEDVEEKPEALITRRRIGKMIITNSSSTETAGYVKGALNKPETVPILSMLEMNVVADQETWDEAFKWPENEPNLSWDNDDEDEGDDRDEGDNQT